MWKKLLIRVIDSLKRSLQSSETMDARKLSSDEKPTKGYGFHTLHRNRPSRRTVYGHRLLAHRSGFGGYHGVALTLSPADSAGGVSNCANANLACIAGCSAGPNAMSSIAASATKSRIEKTRALHSDRLGFVGQLMDEIEVQFNEANAKGLTLLAQLNVSSDIPWETKAYGEIPQEFPDVLFMDFTKLYHRIESAPENYKLVASWTAVPDDQAQCLSLLNKGYDVCVVFAEAEGSFFGVNANKQRLPTLWQHSGKDYAVFDGDFDFSNSFVRTLNQKTGMGRIYGKRLQAASQSARLAAIASGFCVISEQHKTR